MRRFFLAALAFLTFAFPAAAQAKHPFTFEDMMKLKRVGEPEVSPDGKWVIFSVVDVDLAANTKTPHVWIVPTAGGQEKEIISDQDADRPRWAPEGKRFAFISTKEGGSQVWIADFDGSAGTVTSTHKLTSIVTEAGGELWSPDGKNILFTSDVYPECDGRPSDEQSCDENKLKEVEHSKVKAQIFTHLLYRHWNAYKEGKRTHFFVVSAMIETGTNAYDQLRGIPRDLTPGDYDAPVFSLGGQDDYAFSPDGKEICYTSNHDKNPAASTNNDLWIVPVSGGAAKNITADNPASDSTPLYSPDGRYIAYRAQQRPGYESDRFRLMLYDRKNGKRIDLTLTAFDRWVGTFTWAADSSRLYLAAEDKGEAPVYSVEFTSKVDSEPGYDIAIHHTDVHVNELFRGFNDDLAVTPDGKTLLFTRMSIALPNEIFAAPLPPLSMADLVSSVRSNIPQSEIKKSGVSLPITQVNETTLSKIAMSPLESFWFTGAHGDKVEGFLVKPPDFDASKKYPVKFLIHGGPQGAWGDDWSYRWNPELFAAQLHQARLRRHHDQLPRLDRIRAEVHRCHQRRLGRRSV